MSDEVLLAVDEGVLTLMLNRPAKRNALTLAMYEFLRNGLQEASSRTDVGAVLLCAAGDSFCAGNDIADFLDPGGGNQALDFIRALAACDKPLVAALQGHAMGIGATMLLHCDLVYAAPDICLGLPFVNLGLVPEAGSSLLLPARIGYLRAAAMLLLGETMSAEEALAAGLVTALFPASALVREARARATALLRKPRQALSATRALLRGDRASLERRIDEEATAFATARRSSEAREAFAAFLRKRNPAVPPSTSN